ncbi:MAG TPA: bacterial transcriptional activator domain-containing protein, partial [Anaerolineae bacterium]|nr:bacterial transcriptional activator domain-containing protein [Anaerolineae bacterium]
LADETVSRLEYAVDLYRGDFLEGVYADWCLGPRERLREQYLLALETLLRGHQATGQLEAALRDAQRLAQADPLHEDAHLQLIQLYARLGRPHDARAQYRRYETIWRDELQLEPSPHMKALIDQVDPALHLPADPTADETLSHDIQLLNRLTATLRSVPEAQTHEEQQYRERLWAEVAEYGERVGRALKARYANTEALRYLSLAAEALANPPDSRQRSERELSIRRECDELYDLSADRKKQAENLRRADQLAAKLGDPVVRVDLLARRAWLAMERARYSQALVLLRRMLQLCQEQRDTCGPKEALAYRLLGIFYDKTHEVQTALRYHTQALALDEAQKDTQGLCADLNNVANNLMIMGNYPAALAKLEQALSLATPETAPLVRVMIGAHLGEVWMKLAQFAAAADALHEAMELVRKTGDREAECWLGARLATLYQRRSERERALQVAYHYYQVAMELKAPQRMAELAESLAALCCDGEDGGIALIWANRAAELAQTHNLRRYQLRSAMRRAQAYLLLKAAAQAFDCAQQAVDMFERLGHPLEEEAELFWIYAQSAQAVGQERLAISAYQHARMALLAVANLITDAKLREGFLTHHPLRLQGPPSDSCNYL